MSQHKKGNCFAQPTRNVMTPPSYNHNNNITNNPTNDNRVYYSKNSVPQNNISLQNNSMFRYPEKMNETNNVSNKSINSSLMLSQEQQTNQIQSSNALSTKDYARNLYMNELQKKQDASRNMLTDFYRQNIFNKIVHPENENQEYYFPPNDQTGNGNEQLFTQSKHLLSRLGANRHSQGEINQIQDENENENNENENENENENNENENENENENGNENEKKVCFSVGHSGESGIQNLTDVNTVDANSFIQNYNAQQNRGENKSRKQQSGTQNHLSREDLSKTSAQQTFGLTVPKAERSANQTPTLNSSVKFNNLTKNFVTPESLNMMHMSQTSSKSRKDKNENTGFSKKGAPGSNRGLCRQNSTNFGNGMNGMNGNMNRDFFKNSNSGYSSFTGPNGNIASGITQQQHQMNYNYSMHDTNSINNTNNNIGSKKNSLVNSRSLNMSNLQFQQQMEMLKMNQNMNLLQKGKFTNNSNMNGTHSLNNINFKIR
jgi:hypothetical protein